jgi:hypothetical protein
LYKSFGPKPFLPGILYLVYTVIEKKDAVTGFQLHRFRFVMEYSVADDN